jgi:hypothetical protein
MGHESQIELWSPFDRRSGLLVSELTGFVAIKQWKPLVKKTQNAGPQHPSNRAPGAASQNRSRSFKWARSKKTSGLGRDFFLDFFLYRTNRELSQVARSSNLQKKLRF